MLTLKVRPAAPRQKAFSDILDPSHLAAAHYLHVEKQRKTPKYGWRLHEEERMN